MAEEKKDEKGAASKFTDIRISKERRCIADYFVQTGYNYSKTVKILKDNLYDYTENTIRSAIYEVLTGKKDRDISSLSHDIFQIEILKFVQRKADSVVQNMLPLAEQKDPKLRSLPFVYTKKIDDMAPFKQEYPIGLSGLTSKEANFSGVTDTIVKESKPILKKLPTCVWMKARGSAEKWMKVVQRVELFNKNCRLYKSNASALSAPPVVITQAARSTTPSSRTTTVETTKILREYQKGYIKRAKTAILLRDEYSKEVNIYVINNKILIHYAIENMQYYQCDFKVVIKSCCWVKRDRQIEQKLFKQLRMDRGMLKLIMNKHNCVDKCTCCCSEANKAAENTPSSFTTSVKVEEIKDDPDTLIPRTFEDKLVTPKELLARPTRVNILSAVKREKGTYESMYMCYPDGLEVEYQINSKDEIVIHLVKKSEFSMRKQCCWMALPKSIPDTFEPHIHEKIVNRLPHPCPIGQCECCCRDESPKISIEDIELPVDFFNIGIDIDLSEINKANSISQDESSFSFNKEVLMCSKPNLKKGNRKRGKKSDVEVSKEPKYSISIKPSMAPTVSTTDSNTTEVIVKSELLEFEEHFALPIKTDNDMELDKNHTAQENTAPQKRVMIPVSTILDQAPGTQIWVTNVNGKLSSGVDFAPSPISHIIMNTLAGAIAQVKIYVKTLSLPEGKIFINDIIKVGNVCMDIGEWADSEEEFLSIVAQSSQELAAKQDNIETTAPSVLPVVDKVYSLNSETEQTPAQGSKRKAGQSPLLLEALNAKPKKICPNNLKLTDKNLLDKWPSNDNSSLQPQSQQGNAKAEPKSTHNENSSIMSNGKDYAIKTEILSDDEIKCEPLNVTDIDSNDMIGL